MGTAEITLLGDNHWEEIGRSAIPSRGIQLGHTNQIRIPTLRHTHTNQLGQQHLIQVPSLSQELELYTWRIHQKDKPIVGVWSVSVCKERESLCKDQIFMRVITQHPSHNIKGIHLLEDEDVLKVMVECLEGLDVLVEKFGFFRVKPEMINFTQQGEVRVWIHSNFALNWPEEQIENVEETSSEQKMEVFMISQVLSEVMLKARNPECMNFLKEAIIKGSLQGFMKTATSLCLSFRQQGATKMVLQTTGEGFRSFQSPKNRPSSTTESQGPLVSCRPNPQSFSKPRTPSNTQQKPNQTTNLKNHLQNTLVKNHSSRREPQRLLSRVKSQEFFLSPPLQPQPQNQSLRSLGSFPKSAHKLQTKMSPMSRVPFHRPVQANRLAPTPIPRALNRTPTSYTNPNQPHQSPPCDSPFPSVIPPDDVSLSTSNSKDSPPDDYTQII